MKLTDISIKFSPGKRPQVICSFDQLIIDAIEDIDYEARFHADSKVWVYRAEAGDFVSAGAEMKGEGRSQLKMVDGMHTIAALHPTNAIAINTLFGMDYEPVMDCGVRQGELVLPGHVKAIEVAKYLWAQYADPAPDAEYPAIAVIEWPNGVRFYEPVLCHGGEFIVNRPQDKIVYVVRPDTHSLTTA